MWRLVLLFLIVDCSAHQCWVVWSNLAEPQSDACSAVVVETVFLLGGMCNDGICPRRSNDVLSISVSNPLSWELRVPELPITASGAFCSHTEGQVTVSLQTQKTASSSGARDVFVSNYNPDPAPWTSIGLGPHPNRLRAGIAASAIPVFVYLVGGIDDTTNAPILSVDFFNFSSNEWITSTTQLPASACDCHTAGHNQAIVFVCVTCNTSTSSTQKVIFVYNPKRDLFTAGPIYWDAGNGTLSVDVTLVEHYAVIVAAYINRDPILWYFDLFSFQMSYVNTSYISEWRSSGTLFTLSFDMYYAGGIFATQKASSNVDKIPAMLPISLTPDRANYSYNVGDKITVHVGACSRGTTIRLGKSPGCSTNAAGTIDTVCTPSGTGGGTAVLTINFSVPSAFLCVSNGICPSTGRQVCDQNTNYTVFEDCLYVGGCCWDEKEKFCFQFTNGPAEEKFFIQANKQLLKTGWSPNVPPGNKVIIFFSTTTGVAVIVCAGIVFVSLIVVAVWKLATVREDSDDEAWESSTTGSAHPLDQHGKYKIIRKLGQGGFGAVYLVTRKSDGEELALKYIVCKDEEERDYAIQEFELLYASQGHPNMIHLIEMFINWTQSDDPNALPSPKHLNEGTKAPIIRVKPQMKKVSAKKSGDANTPLIQIAPRYVCIVTDYFPEGDLCRYILQTRSTGKDVPENFILNVVARQTCSLLAHLHSLQPPIVHRDIKPENILLKENATQIVLTDFGLAQQVEKTYMTTRAGSLHYVAPECWKRHYTAAVDMWGLGCVLYAACTGRVTSKTARVMFNDAREKIFERDIRYDLRRYSPFLVEVILGLLQPKPTSRLQPDQLLKKLQEKNSVDPANR